MCSRDFQIARDIMSQIIDKAMRIIIKKEANYLASKRQVIIQLLNEKETDEIDPAELLPLKETAEHLVVDDALEIVDEYESSLVLSVISEKCGRPVEDVIHWLPRDVCEVKKINHE